MNAVQGLEQWCLHSGLTNLQVKEKKKTNSSVFGSENHVQFKSGTSRVFGFISASLLCYLHSSERLTHSSSGAHCSTNFMSLLNNSSKEEKSVSPCAGSLYSVMKWHEKGLANSWLAQLSRKKQSSYFECWKCCMIYSDCEGRKLAGAGVGERMTKDLEFLITVTIESVIFQFVQMHSV